MKPVKFRWSKVYESSEEELVAFLQARTIATERIHIAEFEPFNQVAQERPSTIWCAEGSMTLLINTHKFSIQPGDGLPIPVGSSFEATAGMSGCVYYVLSGQT